MGCGCGAGVVRSSPQVFVRQNTQTQAPADCQYTMDQLNSWLAQLICCKNKGLYTSLGINAPTMNKYLGIVMSALNYPTNPCYFQSQLGAIGDFVILIMNTGQC
jgi:hypothetical protein